MSRAIYDGQTYSTFIGLTQQTVGPLTFAGISQPVGLDVPVIGAVGLYRIEYNSALSRYELIDTTEQLLAQNTSGCPIPVNSYVALTLNPMNTPHADYDMVQQIGCGSAIGRPMNGPCPAMSRTLVVTVVDGNNFPCADQATGTITWDGEYWIGRVLLTNCLNAATNTGAFCPWLNLVLGASGGIASGSGLIHAGADILAVGVIGAGGTSSGLPNGSGGGGAAFGYLPVTQGQNYTYTTDASHVQVNGDGGSFVNATAGQGGAAGGAAGSGAFGGAMGSPVPGFATAGAFQGGTGASGSAGSPGGGGGAGGCGGNGTNAVGQIPGVGGIGSDGAAANWFFPSGGDGNGFSPGGGAQGLSGLAGASEILFYQGCLAFFFPSPQPTQDVCSSACPPPDGTEVVWVVLNTAGITTNGRNMRVQVSEECTWTGTGKGALRTSNTYGTWTLEYKQDTNRWELTSPDNILYAIEGSAFSCTGPFNTLSADPGQYDLTTLRFPDLTLATESFGITGCISRPDLLVITLIFCSCDPFELVFQVDNPVPCDCGSNGTSTFFLDIKEP
jgi:hypothetical protein